MKITENKHKMQILSRYRRTCFEENRYNKCNVLAHNRIVTYIGECYLYNQNEMYFSAIYFLLERNIISMATV